MIKKQPEEKDNCQDAGTGISGEELFKRFLLSDARAFEELVEKYEDELFRFLKGIVNDYHEARHLTIEAFSRLATGGKKFAGKSSLKTYLFTIGKNQALRYIKMRGREIHISYEDAIGKLACGGDTSSDRMEQEENSRMLHNAMKDLKDEHRTVLLLLYFQDMSYIQAGRVMNKSEKQIKHLAYRAKAALRKRLEDMGLYDK